MYNISETVSSNLLDICKKNVELFFYSNYTNEEPFLMEIILEILLNGLKLNTCTIFKDKNGSHVAADVLRKLAEDFEWVRSSAQVRDSHAIFPNDKDLDVAASTDEMTVSLPLSDSGCTIEQFLKSWTLRNLKSNCLCACLQALITDNELLEYYYEAGAFLRSERHATSLCICLSALELNQCSLLSQIEKYQVLNTESMPLNRKRSTSHPNFCLLSPESDSHSQCNNSERHWKKHKTNIVCKDKISSHIETTQVSSDQQVFLMFRKVKSLPCLVIGTQNYELCMKRSRSKTFSMFNRSIEAPRHISFSKKYEQHENLPSGSNASSYCENDNDLPSSSTNTSNIHSQISNSITSTNASSSSSLMSSKTPSASGRIHVIKCDDIKIWTDQSVEPSAERSGISVPTEPLQIPAVQSKSISPINSFLCNLFRTPPSLSNLLSITQHSTDEVESRTTADEVTSYFTHDQTESGSTSGVFNTFRIPYGKKLRSRKSQNLFYDDGISYLDYSSIAANNSYTTDTNSLSKNEQPSCSRSQISTLKNQQSLTTFLQMSQMSHNHTELEKENAHFSIAETIISVIEHIKCAKLEPDKWQQGDIGTTKAWNENEQSQRISPNNQQAQLVTSAVNDEDEHIPYAEVGESCLDMVTAEVVGLSLISKFNNQHWPQISDLKWLVSEEDAPQQLLPMPARNDEDCIKSIMPSMTRGTQHWAPPRKQIIFTDHPPPNRRELIEKQNNRCAGCGMRISLSHMQSFRYCTYLGKYHCTGCHRNQISAIPAKILHGWDFKCYPVSVFSYRLLDQMYSYPLFHVPDLNPQLYERASELLNARNKRVRLQRVQNFIKSCRFANKEQQYFDGIPSHITAEPDIWSISDFIDTKRKSLQRFIDELIIRCELHIFKCVLCVGRGFLCEFCQKDNVIYPWQNRIIQCNCCGSCFHEKCWKSMPECSKCQRKNKRCI